MGRRTARARSRRSPVHGRGRARAARHRPARDHPPRLHDGRRGRRHRPHASRSTASAWPRASPLADRPGADRGVGDRLGRVRARGDARPQRQRGDRLLDREHRPDGRAHRRLGHRRAAADAHGRAVPGAARPGDHGDPRGRRRDRRLEHPVRGQPADRRDRRDRDEPARVALARRSPRRPPASRSRRSPRGWPWATRSRRSTTTSRKHAGELRADDRLRGGQVAALRVREVPGRRRQAPHLDAVGRRGDGDRPHLQAGLRQGDALARAGRPSDARRHRRAAAAGWRRPSHDRFELLFEAVRRGVSEARDLRAHRASTPGSWPRSRRSPAARTPRPASSAPSSRSTPARPSSRPRRPTSTRAGSAPTAAPRGRAAATARAW